MCIKIFTEKRKPCRNRHNAIHGKRELPYKEFLYKCRRCHRAFNALPIPPYAVYNIGNNQPENLLDFVQILSEELVRACVLPEDYDFESHKELVPMQPGDVPITYADIDALERDYDFKPSTSLRDGLRRFAEWYKQFYM